MNELSIDRLIDGSLPLEMANYIKTNSLALPRVISSTPRNCEIINLAPRLMQSRWDQQSSAKSPRVCNDPNLSYYKPVDRLMTSRCNCQLERSSSTRDSLAWLPFKFGDGSPLSLLLFFLKKISKFTPAIHMTAFVVDCRHLNLDSSTCYSSETSNDFSDCS